MSAFWDLCMMESLRIPRSQSRLHFCSRLDVLAVCQKGSWWSDLSGLVQVELSTPSKLFSTAAAPATWVQGSRAASHGWTMLQGLLTPGTRAVIADGESIEAPRATALTFNLFKGSIIFTCLPPCRPNRGSTWEPLVDDDSESEKHFGLLQGISHFHSFFFILTWV